MYIFKRADKFRSFSLHFKVTDGSCLGREHGTHLEELAIVRFILTGIALLFNLCQGFIGSAIELELEDVDLVLAYRLSLQMNNHQYRIVIFLQSFQLRMIQ